jgi:hypothetical protein
MHNLSADICNYINKKWIAHWQERIRSFAEEHDVDQKTTTLKVSLLQKSLLK